MEPMEVQMHHQKLFLQIIVTVSGSLGNVQSVRAIIFESLLHTETKQSKIV